MKLISIALFFLLIGCDDIKTFNNIVKESNLYRCNEEQDIKVKKEYYNGCSWLKGKDPHTSRVACILKLKKKYCSKKGENK
jgi:hypothetical protein